MSVSTAVTKGHAAAPIATAKFPLAGLVSAMTAADLLDVALAMGGKELELRVVDAFLVVMRL